MGIVGAVGKTREMEAQKLSQQRLWSIGHSRHTIEEFLAFLVAHGIDVVVDLRTSPFSQIAPQFNEVALKKALKSAGISYLFMGKELGGRPDADEMYDEKGRVHYDLVAQTESFKEGIERLLTGMKTHNIAMMCSEGSPEKCHRTLLVARVLQMRDVEVVNIFPDGTVSVQDNLNEPEPDQPLWVEEKEEPVIWSEEGEESDEWDTVASLAREGDENGARALLENLLGSDGEKLYSPGELRRKILLSVGGFAYGLGIKDGLATMSAVISDFHRLYPWLRKIGVLHSVSDIQALVAAGAWVEVAARLRRDLGRPDLGVKAASVALGNNPNDVAALATQIASWGDMRQWAKAEAAYEKAQRIDPDSAHVNNAWARIEREKGRLREAILSALHAAVESPSRETLRFVGSLYHRFGRLDIAEEYFELAKSAPPDSSDRQTKALIDGYKQWLTRAIKNPDHPPSDLQKLDMSTQKKPQ